MPSVLLCEKNQLRRYRNRRIGLAGWKGVQINKVQYYSKGGIGQVPGATSAIPSGCSRLGFGVPAAERGDQPHAAPASLPAQFAQSTFDGRDIPSVYDHLAAVKDGKGNNVAVVAVAPFAEGFLVGPDVPAGEGDRFAGEITFHLGAVASAAADVDGDGGNVRSAGKGSMVRGATA